MPNNAPKVKINGVLKHGAEVFFCEPDLKARISTANSILEKLVHILFIHLITEMLLLDKVLLLEN